MDRIMAQNEKTMKIYTVTYGPCGELPSEVYVPIVAGAEGRDLSGFEPASRYVFDNDCEDNISSENDTYSEFTALYHMWKNADEDIIGEAHYRRFFVKMGWISYLLGAGVNDVGARTRKAFKKAVTRKDIERYFSQGYNCILPKKTCRFPQGLYEQYKHCTDPYLLDAVRDVLSETFPEYVETYDKVMKVNDYYLKCIFVMPKELYREYAEWMFTVFEKIKERYELHGERELAFLGERIMNIWMMHQTEKGVLRPKEMFYYNTELSPRTALRIGRDMELCIPYKLGRFFEPIMKRSGR